jgi:hypothetical protein
MCRPQTLEPRPDIRAVLNNINQQPSTTTTTMSTSSSSSILEYDRIRALSEFDPTSCLDEHGLSHWTTLLMAERLAVAITPKSSSKAESPLIGVRVVGWLLIDFKCHAQPLGSGPYKKWLENIASCNIPKPGEPVHPTGTDEDNQAVTLRLSALGLTVSNYMFRVCELIVFLFFITFAQREHSSSIRWANPSRFGTYFKAVL